MMGKATASTGYSNKFADRFTRPAIFKPLHCNDLQDHRISIFNSPKALHRNSKARRGLANRRDDDFGFAWMVCE